MKFELDPPHGVGPLRIGMVRGEAAIALKQLGEAGAHSESDSQNVRIFRPSGLMVSIDCMHDRLLAVELGRPQSDSSDSDTVSFRGVDVFNLPAKKVVEQLRERVAIEQDEDDPASYCARELVLTLWRPFAADDEPDEVQGHYFSSVLVAAPGYYDTPDEAAERVRMAGDG